METLALFVFGLLLLGDAHASTGSGSTLALVGDHFPAVACEPAALATQVAAPCVAVGMPTPTCCHPLVAVVDLGGGLRCLCRVAAEPEVVLVGLNATHLVGLYISCGGLHAGDLPAAYKGAVVVVVARSERPAAALPGAISAAAQVHSLATPDVDVARPEHQAAALPGSAVVATQNHSFAVAVARPEHHAPAFPGAIAAQDHSLAVARPEHQAAVYPDTGNDQPTVVVVDTQNLNNFDRRIMTIMEIVAGAQLVLALLRGLINHLSVNLANRRKAAKCRNGHDRHGEAGDGPHGEAGDGIYGGAAVPPRV